MGISPSDDRLPNILLKPLDGTECAGKSPNFEQLKRECYKYRQWDIESGTLNQANLKRLNLADL